MAYSLAPRAFFRTQAPGQGSRRSLCGVNICVPYGQPIRTSRPDDGPGGAATCTLRDIDADLTYPRMYSRLATCRGGIPQDKVVRPNRTPSDWGDPATLPALVASRFPARAKVHFSFPATFGSLVFRVSRFAVSRFRKFPKWRPIVRHSLGPLLRRF